MTPCLNETTVLAFLAGTLSPPERATVESHVAACSACVEVLTWAAADSANVSRAPGREGPPFLGQLAPGARVDRYQVLGPIGRGGMGEVYAAYHPDLDRRIALKIVFEASADAAERRARLLREARAIARLSHPNVVTVFDAGTVGDRVYIAMEYIDGETLDAWLAAKARGWAEILDVFVAAGRGLAAAHAARIIHRDFKPQNVMIARDGSVRVMDFGLAQLLREEAISSPGSSRDALAMSSEVDVSAEDSFDGSAAAPGPTRATKTGARLGTPAYMAPEQWRGETTDARADQFSFCVALHEALYGVRPTLDHHSGPLGIDGERKLHRAVGVPAWLRAVITRGLATARERRYPSMDELLRAVTRGRTRLRRRLSVVAATATALALVVELRLARERRIDCAPPRDRLAASWAPNAASNPRRQAIHARFLASGRPSAETSWQRVSRLLDDYLIGWSAMYVDTCEATQVRGEQSGEVLDLRMSCLAENLDEVRALTDVLVSADASAIASSVTAVQDLTPVKRCADLEILRSAVPLPRDDRTLRAVREVERSLRDALALDEVGNRRESLAAAKALRSRAEAIGYRPLVARVLDAIGRPTTTSNPARAESILEEAVVDAEIAHEDVTVARAMSTLTYAVGYGLGRTRDGLRWARLAEAVLDRLGPGNSRLRAWVKNDAAAVMAQAGDYRGAQALFEEAVRLKEKELGSDHPDVAVSLGNAALADVELGKFPEALAASERAVVIYERHGDPDTWTLGGAYSIRGESLAKLGKREEAAADFRRALQILEPATQADAVTHSELATALHRFGSLRLDQQQPESAVPMLERALEIRQRSEIDQTLVAETRFLLARALWDSGGSRTRARSLATNARKDFEARRSQRVHAVDAWLSARDLRE
jgi:serine/threonine protein kinase/tetratricopeptide (TPR) repeat protein